MANPVDVHVGAKLRLIRNARGMSQAELGKQVGVAFQQIQKYEKGTNRVSASKLYDFSKILKVSFDFFLNGFTGYEQKTPYAVAGMSDGEQEGFEVPQKETMEDLMNKRETIKLVRAYYNIEDPKVRKQLLVMAKTMGNGHKK